MLTETGDNLGNTITTSRDAAGQIFVNGGAVSIRRTANRRSPTPTKSYVSGGNGNDTISLDNAALARSGNALTGTADLFGGNGNDTLNGGDGNDILFGGTGDDTVVGGKGTDTAFLGAGNDTFIWNPGDGNDVVEGGSGFDTLDFRGANRQPARPSASIANGSGATFTRTGNGTIDLTSVERIQFEAQGQNADNITINDLTGTDVKQVAIDLGAGAGRRRRWSGGHGLHQLDQRPTDHGHRQQRRGHGVGSGQHRDDLQLRGRPRSSLHQ